MRKVLKVDQVARGAQGERIGMLVDDLILSYDSTPVGTNISLSNAAYQARKRGKDKVRITVVRHGERRRLTASPQEQLGIECVEAEYHEPKVPSAPKAKNSLVPKTTTIIYFAILYGLWQSDFLHSQFWLNLSPVMRNGLIGAAFGLGLALLGGFFRGAAKNADAENPDDAAGNEQRSGRVGAEDTASLIIAKLAKLLEDVQEAADGQKSASVRAYLWFTLALVVTGLLLTAQYINGSIGPRS